MVAWRRLRGTRGTMMTYGVALRTLDRAAGNGVTMLFVAAPDPLTAEQTARRLAEERLGCLVHADHAVPCPKFKPTA
jgi:hypothetical protein